MSPPPTPSDQATVAIEKMTATLELVMQEARPVRWPGKRGWVQLPPKTLDRVFDAASDLVEAVAHLQAEAAEGRDLGILKLHAPRGIRGELDAAALSSLARGEMPAEVRSAWQRLALELLGCAGRA